MKTQNSVSQKIWILHKFNEKIYFIQKYLASEKRMLISMHSIFGQASFCMNYCIDAVWHGGNQPVALLGCNGSPVCFNSGLQVICIVGSGVEPCTGLKIYALARDAQALARPVSDSLSELPARVRPEPVLNFSLLPGEFAGQSCTVTPWSLNQLLVPLAVWAGVKSCWKMKSASP